MTGRLVWPALLALVASLGVAPGRAKADAPRAMLPTRDVQVRYHVDSDQLRAPSDVTVHAAPGGRLRIDGGERGFILFSAADSHAAYVMPAAHLVVDLPLDGALVAAFLPGSDTRFSRGGSATIAGLDCTEWQASTARGHGKGCVTDDGVLLSGQGEDRRGHSGRLRAVDVAYAAQAAELFEIPPGFLHVDLGRLRAAPPPKP